MSKPEQSTHTYDGQLALVTGASSGIGVAIARTCADRGATVLLTARRGDKLDAVRAALPQPECHRAVSADLEEEMGIANLAHEAEQAARDTPLGILVLNAGAALNAPVEDTTLEQWDHLFALNVRAPFLLVKRLLPLLRANPHGARIIVIGSVVSTKAYIDQAAYTASKHALYGFTRVLAKELHREDSAIRVHSINPGGVNTDLVRSVRPDIDQSRLIDPTEIADIAGSLLDMQGNAFVEEVRVRRRTKEPWA